MKSRDIWRQMPGTSGVWGRETILDDTVIPYAMLCQGAARVAGWLTELGVQPGDRAAVSMPNIPHIPIIYCGILWAGAVVVPMNPP